MERQGILVRLAAFLIGGAWGMIVPIMPLLIATETGTGFTGPGLAGAAVNLPYAVLVVLVGIMLYRYSTRALLAAGIIIYIAMMVAVALGVVADLGSFVLLSVMLGLSYALFWPPMNAIVSDMSDDLGVRARQRMYFYTSHIVGLVAGPFLGYVILQGAGGGAATSGTRSCGWGSPCSAARARPSCCCARSG